MCIEVFAPLDECYNHFRLARRNWNTLYTGLTRGWGNGDRFPRVGFFIVRSFVHIVLSSFWEVLERKIVISEKRPKKSPNLFL